MNIQEIRDEIFSLMDAAKRETNPNENLKTVQKICSLLEENSALREDPEVVKTYLKFSKDKENPTLKQWRWELGRNSLFTFNNGFLMIAKPDSELLTYEEMNALFPPNIGRFYAQNRMLVINDLTGFAPEAFWNFIKKNSVQSLILARNGEGGPIRYDQPLLTQLAYKKPPLDSLTRNLTLEFRDGKKIVLPLAKLLLCGTCFKPLSEEMFRPADGRISLGISSHGFRQVLRNIETGEEPFPDIIYSEAANYLGFTPYQPPRIYAKEQWEKFWGNVGDVPAIPRELIEDLNRPCPVYNRENSEDGLKMSDTHQFFYMPKSVDGKKLSVERIKEIAESGKFKDKNVRVNFYMSLNGIQEEEGGYWFAVAKPIEETTNMTTEQQKNYLMANLPKEYDFPSTTEALVHRLMPYVQGRESNFDIRCKDVVDNEHVIVTRPNHLLITAGDEAHHGICVSPVKRYQPESNQDAMDLVVESDAMDLS